MKMNDLDEGVEWQKDILESMAAGTILGKGEKQRSNDSEGGRLIRNRR